jgi:hypothetical protein
LRSFLATLLLVLCPCLQAQTQSPQLQAVLTTLLKDQVVTIRNYFRGDRLEANATGDVIGGKPGWWTADGTVQIKSVKVKDQKVELEGERMALYFNEGKNNIDYIRLGRKVKILLPVSAATDRDAVTRALRRLLISPDELALQVPACWQKLLRHEPLETNLKKLREDFPLPNGSMRVRDGIESPKPIHIPNPTFTDPGRAIKFNGQLLTAIIISENGNIDDVIILKPVGLGIDETAVEKIRTWRFKPALKDGKPVRALAFIETGYAIH